MQEQTWYENVYVWTMKCWSCEKKTRLIRNVKQLKDENGILSTMSGELDYTIIKKIAKDHSAIFRPYLEMYDDPYACFCNKCDMIQGSYYLNCVIATKDNSKYWIDKSLIYSEILKEYE